MSWISTQTVWVGPKDKRTKNARCVMSEESSPQTKESNKRSKLDDDWTKIEPGGIKGIQFGYILFTRLLVALMHRLLIG